MLGQWARLLVEQGKLGMKYLILKNRYTLLITVLAAFMVVLVIEGVITGRQARVLDFDNPFFDLNIKDIEELRDRRS